MERSFPYFGVIRAWPGCPARSPGEGALLGNTCRNAIFLGKRLSVSNGARKISGVFYDLGMDGALLLLDDSGHTHHITTGDVQLLDN